MDDAPNQPPTSLARPLETVPAPQPRRVTKGQRAATAARTTGLASWVSLGTAASHLGSSPDALRRMLERRAVKAPDGGIEAEIDGVRARKLGRLWRVRLSPAWLPGDAR